MKWLCRLCKLNCVKRFHATTTLSFPHLARTTYTAIKRLFGKNTQFSSVDCNDDLFIVEARHGAFLSPFSENVKIMVVATDTHLCKVAIESSSRSWLNLLNFGANKDNVSELSDYISNEVYRLQQPGEIPMTDAPAGRPLRFKTPDIMMK